MCGKLCFSWTVCVVVTCAVLLVDIANTQLLINVKNQGGDVLQESISANVSDDTVTLEFQRSDGTLITQLMDFAHDVQILKALVLGEEERGQSQYQVMCFVCHFQKSDFISSDAMSKLRQKNPGTVRTPEEDRGRDNHTMDYFVVLPRAALISRHIATLCAEAPDSTYTRREDLLQWAKQPGASESTLMSAVRPFPSSGGVGTNRLSVASDVGGAVSALSGDEVTTCGDSAALWSACRCRLETCIGWYPCGLKYCKSKDSKSAAMTYRCGIKTCRKCYLFAYYVPQKQLCLWDE